MKKTGILTSLKASGKGEVERGAPVFLACLPARILVRVLGVGRRCRRRLELKGRVRDRPARRLLTRRVAWGSTRQCRGIAGSSLLRRAARRVVLFSVSGSERQRKYGQRSEESLYRRILAELSQCFGKERTLYKQRLMRRQERLVVF